MYWICCGGAVGITMGGCAVFEMSWARFLIVMAETTIMNATPSSAGIANTQVGKESGSVSNSIYYYFIVRTRVSVSSCR